MMERERRVLTPEEALQRAASYCVKAERCIRQVRDKLYQWGIRGEDIETIVETLVERQFIDEGRYARAYARDKHRLSSWGTRRIESELRQRGIPSDVVRQAIGELEQECETSDQLRRLLERRLRTISREVPRRKAWEQLARYALYRGYDYEDIRPLLASLLEGDEGEDS